MDQLIGEILRNIELRKCDVSDNNITELFFERSDVSDMKKEALKKL